MNKKNSIKSKIKKQTMLISLISVFIVCAVALIGITYMRGSVVDISEELGSSAASDSMTALEAQMEESMLTLAKNKATISNEKLMAVSKLVEMISANATKIMSNPDVYKEHSVLFPNAANAGTVVAQLRLEEGVVYEEVADEIGLIGNIQDLLVSAQNHSESSGSVYIGTERGVSISADVNSDQKTNVFDPTKRSWYIAAKEKDGLIWTDVFSDNSGRGAVISCAKPFYDATGKMRGVAGLGMILEELQKIVIGTNIGNSGYAFILNEKAEIIISDMNTTDDDGNIQRINLLDEGAMLPGDTVSWMLTVSRMLNGESAVERVDIDGMERFVAYAPLSELPWSLVVVMDVDEVIAPALEIERNIISMTESATDHMDSVILLISLTFLLILALIVLADIIQANRLANQLAGPIIELSEGAEIIGAGDLEYLLDIKTGDEIEALSNTFNRMIEGIKNITAEKERISTELDVATRLQAGLLPCIFPAFPEREEFDVYATMQPAKEVGGDFYDFFLVDPDHLAVVIADVSGKGVPAALFMVIAKTLIKNLALVGVQPAEVFETANNMLCENNEVGMFVTAFMGVYEVSSGKFTYTNAGHNPPLIKRGDGDYNWLATKPGFVLAGMEGMKYVQTEIVLQKGDALFLYTDGVTEAVNTKNILFSDPKLLSDINKHRHLPLAELLPAIKKEIDSFADGAEQADDITMLGLIVKG